MSQSNRPQAGFVCAYTPLVLIDAAGFGHFRILPDGDWPDQAGHLLHDNLCPHVKRVLDRALDKDIPNLAGMIFTNSCDAMRRAADAWGSLNFDHPLYMIDLPATSDENAALFLADEFDRLAKQLQRWGGENIEAERIKKSIGRYNRVAELFGKLRERARQKLLNGGRTRLQALYNMAATQGFDAARKGLEAVMEEPTSQSSDNDRVPIFLFGNVLADPGVYSLLEFCGAHIVGDDFCTSLRMFSTIDIDDSEDIFLELARCVLSQPPCARTFDSTKPGNMATDILKHARACNASGVIGHTLKFCDPYLARLPQVRDVFKKEQLPLLLLEGDCTLRSFGQQRTRIEAFIEMLR